MLLTPLGMISRVHDAPVREPNASIREQLACLSREYYRIAEGISRLLRDG